MFRQCARASKSVTSKMREISLDSFAFRQFDEANYAGTKIKLSKEEFMNKVLDFFEKRKSMVEEVNDRPALMDGYAPFCKHLFMPNFDDSILDGDIEITSQNEHLLRTEFCARNEKELPVLLRFFPSEAVSPAVSRFLDLILYSREQVEKEHAAMGKKEVLDDAPWRLIGIKGQAVPYEIPMSPITMMRNELISQGGSGVPIAREAYMKSVEYWKTHATVR